MNKCLQNAVGFVHIGALFGLVDEITSLLRIVTTNDSITFVSVFIDLQMFQNSMPLGEKISVIARFVN